MNKQLARLETSFDNEHHVYVWKQTETWQTILLWISIGLSWLIFIDFWRRFKWEFVSIYFLVYVSALILYSLYRTVLKTTIEINADELRLVKTPFNLLGKNIKLENIKRVYSEQQMLGSRRYNVKAKLTNGKTKKLFFGLKEDVANELAEHIGNSIKHFQNAQLIPSRNTRQLGLND